MCRRRRHSKFIETIHFINNFKSKGKERRGILAIVTNKQKDTCKRKIEFIHIVQDNREIFAGMF